MKFTPLEVYLCEWNEEVKATIEEKNGEESGIGGVKRTTEEADVKNTRL